MKKITRFLAVFVSAIMLLTNICVFADSAQSIAISSTTVAAESEALFTVTVNGFAGFTGAYDLRISLPEFVSVNSVKCNGTALVNEYDYQQSGTTLKIMDDVGYEGETTFTDSMVFTVNFSTVKAASGTYNVGVLPKSYFLSDNDGEYTKIYVESISTSGSINLISNVKADINGDLTANAIDLSALRYYLLGKTQTGAFDESIADINFDSKIDIKDIVAFKKYLTNIVVFLSDNGDDGNDGKTAGTAVKTFDKAADLVYENGTIYIVDTYTLAEDFIWMNHLKPIRISGGTFDASAVHPLRINDNTTFTDCTVIFQNNANVYANGNKLFIDSNVTVNNLTHLYGGSSATVDSTDITILSGSYYDIIGGGNGSNGNVTGDTNVIVGGNVNNDSEFDVTNHSLMRRIIGGSVNGTVGGNVNLTVKDYAKSINIYGGGKGNKSLVGGKTNVTISGGTHMSAYAGSYEGTVTETELDFTGGTIQQLFGGSLGTGMTGNTRINLLGGTVTRRIYGGCYNELASSGLFSYSWSTDYHVTGNTTVFLSSSAEVNFDTSYSDRGIFAGTRYKSAFDDENAVLIYEDAAAQTEFSGKLGQKDSSANMISDWPSAYDSVEIQNS